MEEPATKKLCTVDVDKQAIKLIKAALKGVNYASMGVLADGIYERILSPSERSKINCMDFGFQESTRNMVQAIKNRHVGRTSSAAQALWGELSTATQAHWREKAREGKKTPAQEYKETLTYITDVEEKKQIIEAGNYSASMFTLPKILIDFIVKDRLGLQAMQHECEQLGEVPCKVLFKFIKAPAFWEAMAQRDIRTPLEEGLKHIELLLTRLDKKTLGGKQNYNHLLTLYRKTLPEQLRQLDSLIEKGELSYTTYSNFFHVGAMKIVTMIVDTYVSALCIDGDSESATYYFTEPDSVALYYKDEMGDSSMAWFGTFLDDAEKRYQWEVTLNLPGSKAFDIAGIHNLADLLDESKVVLDPSEEDNLSNAANRIASTWSTALWRTLTHLKAPADFTFIVDVDDLPFKFKDPDMTGAFTLPSSHPDRFVMSAKTGFAPVFIYPELKAAKKLPAKFLIPSLPDADAKEKKEEKEEEEESSSSHYGSNPFYYDGEAEAFYLSKITALLEALPAQDPMDEDRDDEEEEEEEESDDE